MNLSIDKHFSIFIPESGNAENPALIYLDGNGNEIRRTQLKPNQISLISCWFDVWMWHMDVEEELEYQIGSEGWPDEMRQFKDEIFDEYEWRRTDDTQWHSDFLDAAETVASRHNISLYQ